MADATSNQNLSYDAKLANDQCEGEIASSEQVVINGFVSMLYGTGHIDNADDADGHIPFGVAVKQAVGDNSSDGLTGDGSNKVITEAGKTITRVSVTGASSDADNGKLVYATDNQTLTLTKPTTGLPFGFVKRWITSTYCEVRMFTLGEAIMWGFVPRKETVFLGVVSSMALGGTAAADLLKYTLRKHSKITDFYAYPVSVDDAITAGDQTLNLEIGTTNLTGGELNLTEAECDALDDLGTKTSASSITANNEGHEGDVVTVELQSGGTAFTDDKLGAFGLYMDLTILPGA